MLVHYMWYFFWASILVGAASFYFFFSALLSVPYDITLDGMSGDGQVPEDNQDCAGNKHDLIRAMLLPFWLGFFSAVSFSLFAIGLILSFID